ncbi:glycosyltransferase family 4 protein [Thalassoglobus sp.]|uniref:glycosyltransferase family 4 protein n=1 Tax=Thalassoglobus sp. TaxID=2795869 RepID=UPI003AA82908
MPIKVCFVALNAYPAIDPEAEGTFGGIETRSWAFARALAQNPEFEVSFLVRHWNPLREGTYEGVQLHLMRDRFFQVRDSLLSRFKTVPRFPWIQLKQPQLSDVLYLPLLAGLKVIRKRRGARDALPAVTQIDADLFLTFGVQSFSATVIASAQATGRPAVLFLGSDGDLDENYLPGNKFVSVYRDSADVCYWTIQNATQILCQTKFQQTRLKKLFQRESRQVQNPIDLDDWDGLSRKKIEPALHANLDRYALWIGRAESVHKRPQVLLEVAAQCPGVKFLMIMNRHDEVFAAEIKKKAPANVSIVEKVPFPSMAAIFSRAAVLVNTSSLEGFPNTYLQAAASNVPIASLSVEQDFLSASNSGYFANGNVDELSGYVRDVWEERISPVTGREYVERHHNINQQTELLAESLKDVLKSS